MAEVKATLLTALLGAQQSAQALEKDAKNEFHKYRYVASDTMIAEARRVLGDAGLTLAAVGWKLNDAADRVTIKVELAHGESATTVCYEVEVPVVVERGRPPDKALFGALTEGLAYFCRGLLLIPRVDGVADDTPSARDDRSYDPPARKPAAKAKPEEYQQKFAAAVEKLFPDTKPADILGHIQAAMVAALDKPPAKWRDLGPADLTRVFDKLKEEAGRPAEDSQPEEVPND